MPTIRLSRGIDVFAFLDSDSDEAKAFTTYLGYWDGLARHIVELYGQDPIPGLAASVLSRPQVQRLASKAFAGDADELRRILLNGWAQELGLYAVDDDDPRLMLQNLRNNVQAYYAMSGAARAFLFVRSGQLPTTHAQTLKATAGLVTGTDLLPEPWNYCCTAESPTFAGFRAAPGECHNLDSQAVAADVVAKALKTTRRKALTDKVDLHKQQNKLARAPSGFRQAKDRGLRPTTVFDFMWRSRTRSNYGDPSMFYMGSLSQERSVSYVKAVQLVTSATMLVFEAMVVQKAPQILTETAVHFMARDRSQITDLVLGERLRALGLLVPPAAGEPDDENDW